MRHPTPRPRDTQAVGCHRPVVIPLYSTVQRSSASHDSAVYNLLSSGDFMLPFDAHCCRMGTAIKHHMPDRLKPSFVIFDIRASPVSCIISSFISTPRDLRNGVILFMRPDSLPRLWRYINLLLTYLLTYSNAQAKHQTAVPGLNPIWHRMLYSCTNMATVGIK